MTLIPFNQSEIDEALRFTVMDVIPMTIFKTPITAQENFRRALEHETPMWLPNVNDKKMLVARCNPDNTCRCLESEDAPMECPPDEVMQDMFGIHWKYVPAANGPIEDPDYPYLLEDMSQWEEKIVIPDPDTWDWEKSAEQNKAYVNDGSWVCFWMFCGYYERLISFLGVTEATVELVDDDYKPYIHSFFDKLTGVYEKIIATAAKSYHIDEIFFHDDWGSERASMLSPNTIREMIAPYLKRVVDCAHKNGLKFELHSCGCNATNIPVMIECGVDMWQPQTRCNDTAKYWEEYGDKIMLGIDMDFPPNMSDEECIEAVKAFVEKYGSQMKNKPSFYGATPDFMYLYPKLSEYCYEYSRRYFCG